jgi:adenylylsulfate kinase
VESVEAGAQRIFQALLDMGNVTAEELRVITGKRMRASPPAKKGARARPAARAARVAKPRKAKGKR